MQYVIVAVGRWKLSSEQSLYKQFEQRIRPPLQLLEVEEKKRIKKPERSRREGQLLLDAVPNKAHMVVLDSNGIGLSSIDLARHLKRWRDDGVRTTAFLIGGANGHDTAVLARADLTLSFGPQTWPHLMVRVMLAEQLYRVQSILAGHPYHRE